MGAKPSTRAEPCNLAIRDADEGLSVSGVTRGSVTGTPMAVDRGRFRRKEEVQALRPRPQEGRCRYPHIKRVLIYYTHIGTACNFDVAREAMFIFMVEGKRTRRSNSPNLQG